MRTLVGALVWSLHIFPGLAAAQTPAFTMDQTLSDEAQRTTLAFDGLAMMTGNLDAQSFFPPGKVANNFGFQYCGITTPTTWATTPAS